MSESEYEMEKQLKYWNYFFYVPGKASFYPNWEWWQINLIWNVQVELKSLTIIPKKFISLMFSSYIICLVDGKVLDFPLLLGKLSFERERFWKV